MGGDEPAKRDVAGRLQRSRALSHYSVKKQETMRERVVGIQKLGACRMKRKKKAGHGGRRPGAGRPKKPANLISELDLVLPIGEHGGPREGAGRPREFGPRGDDDRLFTPDHGTVSLTPITDDDSLKSDADDHHITHLLDADAGLSGGQQKEWRFVKGTRHRVAFVPNEGPALEELLAKVPEHRREQILEKLNADEINEIEAIRMLRSETGPPRPKPVENPYDRAHMETRPD